MNVAEKDIIENVCKEDIENDSIEDDKPLKINKVAFHKAHNLISDDFKLQLRIGTIIENVLFNYIKDMDYEHLIPNIYQTYGSHIQFSHLPSYEGILCVGYFNNDSSMRMILYKNIINIRKIIMDYRIVITSQRPSRPKEFLHDWPTTSNVPLFGALK
ncbi:hypothetical protein C1645_877176 [Glomus cerebriforme]|uniref:Uncharacterized protein n=1 Tax=Glomus cerebriforme TaxID=658196 RepID=A0A397SUZ1_9GLOM|nr:hypothetical protein C1645_832652 [Glomus cerebriforme]RIA88759.1 hypothetical protein C1645_877176 [Glomus cerebriforme]